MSRLELIYLEVRKKKFNKWETLNKFLNTKAYLGLEIQKKKNGVYHKLPFNRELEVKDE